LERGDGDSEDLLGGEAAARLGWRFSWSSAAANAERDREACRLRFRLSISIAVNWICGGAIRKFQGDGGEWGSLGCSKMQMRVCSQ
jgi:hypothetical protein